MSNEHAMASEIFGIPELIIRPPTCQEEFDRVAFYLHNHSWYIFHGYSLALPNHPFVQDLLKTGADLSVLDTEKAKKLFEDQIFDPEHYQTCLESLMNDRLTIQTALSRLQILQVNWGFIIPPKIEVILTAYGRLGSYNSQSGSITASASGEWPPRRIVLHEAVHIGIKAPIVNSFHLTHWEAERLVDLLCLRFFPDLLPGYPPNKNGIEKIDSFFAKAYIAGLPASIEKYVRQYPR